MEKWAKSQNAHKEALKTPFKNPNTGFISTERRESAAADAGFAILEKTVSIKKGNLLRFPPQKGSGGNLVYCHCLIV